MKLDYSFTGERKLHFYVDAFLLTEGFKKCSVLVKVSITYSELVREANVQAPAQTY